MTGYIILMVLISVILIVFRCNYNSLMKAYENQVDLNIELRRKVEAYEQWHKNGLHPCAGCGKEIPKTQEVCSRACAEVVEMQLSGYENF